MKAFFLFLLFAVSLAHAGEMTYKSDNMIVVLKNEACDNLLFMVTLSRVGDELGTAVVTIAADGRRINACWTLDSTRTKVVLMDDDGDIGYILLSDFKDEPGV